LDPTGSNTATLWTKPGIVTLIISCQEINNDVRYPSSYVDQEVSNVEAFNVDPIEEQMEAIDSINTTTTAKRNSSASEELLQWHIRCGNVSMY
jgi:hypothetical protein